MQIGPDKSDRELTSLLNNLLTAADVFDAQTLLGRVEELVMHSPELTSLIPHELALTIFHNYQRETDEVVRRLGWIPLLYNLLTLAPRLTVTLLASEEPNASYCILHDLHSIVTHATPATSHEIIEAMLTLLNNPAVEARVSDKIPVGSINHDKYNERYKFRVGITKALKVVIGVVPTYPLDTLFSRLREIYAKASSVDVLRAVLSFYRDTIVPASDVMRCIEVSLQSTCQDVLRETGITLSASAIRICSMWNHAHTNLLLTQFNKIEWLARAELANGLASLIEAGCPLTIDQAKRIAAHVCEKDEHLGLYEAAESQFKMDESAHLVHEMRAIGLKTRNQLYRALTNALTYFSETDIEEFALFIGSGMENMNQLSSQNGFEVTLDHDKCFEYVPLIWSRIISILDSKI